MIQVLTPEYVCVKARCIHDNDPVSLIKWAFICAPYGKFIGFDKKTLAALPKEIVCEALCETLSKIDIWRGIEVPCEKFFNEKTVDLDHDNADYVIE